MFERPATHVFNVSLNAVHLDGAERAVLRLCSGRGCRGEQQPQRQGLKKIRAAGGGEIGSEGARERREGEKIKAVRSSVAKMAKHHLTELRCTGSPSCSYVRKEV